MMWEQIRRNQRRSFFLIVLLGLILAVAGGAIGAAAMVWAGASFENWMDLLLFARWGVAGGCVIWLVLMLTAYSAGESLLLSGVGAQEMRREDAPRLCNIVEEMAIAAGLPQPPRLFLIDSSEPNAFAVGRDPKTAAVAITSGLARRLTCDELQGVIAHEIGHIRNLDVRFMTYAGVMVGSIVMICDAFWRMARYSTRGARYTRGRGKGGQAQGAAVLILFVVAGLMAILAPIAARLLYLACSRKREYLADASAAVFTRYPAGLASALEKIAGSSGLPVAGGQASGGARVTAPMFIVNPLQSRSAFGLFSTHPPLEKRVAILRDMAGAASFGEYDNAFKRAMNRGGGCIGEKTIQADAALPIRLPFAEPPDEMLVRGQEALGFLGRSAGYLMIPCACGMQIKLPRGYDASQIGCPRCGRGHATSSSVVSTAAGAGAALLNAAGHRALTPAETEALRRDLQGPAPAAGRASRPAQAGSSRTGEGDQTREAYRRKSPGGWESFRCGCGHALQLSPSFIAGRVSCGKCGRRIEIRAE